MTATALRGHHSTEPRAVDRATNTTRQRAEACPDVVAYHRELREAGWNLSLSAVRRFMKLYRATYDDTEGFLAYLLDYLDLTGETATNRALRAQVGGVQ